MFLRVTWYNRYGGKMRYRRSFAWSTLHYALLISILFHVVLLIFLGLSSPRKVQLSPDFKVIFVDAEDILIKAEEHPPPESKAQDPPPPAADAVSPPEPATLTDSAPPSLPSAPVFQMSTTEVSSSAVKVRPDAGTPEGTSPRGGPGEGVPGGMGKISGISLDSGCRLFILPVSAHPLTTAEALPLCEGISGDEKDLALTIDFKMSLAGDGQPYDIRLVHSSGNKEVDRAAQDLMQFMRFDTSSVPSPCYLTMLIIGRPGDR
jgi:hypothetical protein